MSVCTYTKSLFLLLFALSLLSFSPSSFADDPQPSQKNCEKPLYVKMGDRVLKFEHHKPKTFLYLENEGKPLISQCSNTTIEDPLNIDKAKFSIGLQDEGLNTYGFWVGLEVTGATDSLSKKKYKKILKSLSQKKLTLSDLDVYEGYYRYKESAVFDVYSFFSTEEPDLDPTGMPLIMEDCLVDKALYCRLYFNWQEDIQVYVTSADMDINVALPVSIWRKFVPQILNMLKEMEALE